MAFKFIRTWYAYLIRLARPLGGHRHQAQFYLGIALDWQERYRVHAAGKGAKMLAAAVKQCIPFRVVRLWEFLGYTAARAFEVWTKKSVKDHKRLLRLPIPEPGQPAPYAWVAA